MYADDTTVLIWHGPAGNIVIDILKTYEKASGSQVNIDKSRACIIAGKPDVTISMATKSTTRRRPLNIYGVLFGEQSDKINENLIMETINITLESQRRRYQ
jgi:hypothetical protein